MSSQTDIRVEQHFPVSCERLWHALTEPSQMRQWFFENIPDFKAKEGFSTEFDVDTGEKIFKHAWRVLEAKDPRHMVWQWLYPEYAGQSKVLFSLLSKAKGCKLILVHQGMDTFPQHIPEFSKKSCKQGWEYFINQRLVQYMDSTSGP